jgi:hypothetical protein
MQLRVVGQFLEHLAAKFVLSRSRGLTHTALLHCLPGLFQITAKDSLGVQNLKLGLPATKAHSLHNSII